MHRLFTAALCLAWFLAVPDASAGKPRMSPEAAATLLAEAAERWDRRALAESGVAVEATVAIRLPGKEPLDGRWRFEQVAPGLFREELELPGFREQLVADERGWWLDRKPERYLQLVADLQDALEPARRLRIGDERSVTAARIKKQKGRSLLLPRIVAKKGSPPAAFDLRVDAATGAPVRFDCRHSFTSYEYEGELAVGETRFPRVVRVLHSNKPVVVVELTLAEPRPAKQVLTPPEGAQPAIPEWGERCDKLRAPVAKLSPPLRYPPSAAFIRAGGQVEGRLIIDETGRIVARHVHWASDPVFADAALAALDGRNYRPGRCEGEPVSFLTRATFWFQPDPR